MPPVTRHLAGISTRGLDMQSVYGARDFGYEVGPLAREDQCLDEQDQPVGPHQAINHRFRVGLRRTRTSRRLFHTLGDMEDVATRGLDEQRLLGAEVVGDLTWEGIGCASDSSNRSAIETVRLEKRACHVEEAGTHFLAGGARCSYTVARRVGMGLT